ncbi:TPA: O51 family O-antigen flippase, partial [Escherichia coli]|nr:O51 family O-antigen flippase [Escherichia coli]
YDIVGYFYIIHRIFKFIASAILIIGLTLSFIMPYLVKDNINWHDIYIPWVFYVIATALSYFYSAETVLLTASEKLYIVRIVNGLARVITFLIQIVVLKNGGGFIIFSALEILYVLIQYILFRYYVLKLYGAYLYSKTTLSKELPLIKQTIIKEIKK